MSSRLIQRVRDVVQQLGGGGGKAPPHAEPLSAPPAVSGEFVIVPGLPDPAWPTPSYVDRLGRRIGRLRGDHPEVYDAWRAFMEDYIATVPIDARGQINPSDVADKHRRTRATLVDFTRKYGGLLDDDPDDPPES